MKKTRHKREKEKNQTCWNSVKSNLEEKREKRKRE